MNIGTQILSLSSIWSVIVKYVRIDDRTRFVGLPRPSTLVERTLSGLFWGAFSTWLSSTQIFLLFTEGSFLKGRSVSIVDKVHLVRTRVPFTLVHSALPLSVHARLSLPLLWPVTGETRCVTRSRSECTGKYDGGWLEDSTSTTGCDLTSRRSTSLNGFQSIENPSLRD